MTTGDDQTGFKNTVKQWLKSHGLDYRWVAERCGVSEITVRNWMSQKNIPPLKQQLIERLMVQLPATAARQEPATSIPGVSVDAALSLTVRLVPDMYRKLTERALEEGMTPEALVARAIAELVHPQQDRGSLPGMKMREVLLPPQA